MKHNILVVSLLMTSLHTSYRIPAFKHAPAQMGPSLRAPLPIASQAWFRDNTDAPSKESCWALAVLALCHVLRDAHEEMSGRAAICLSAWPGTASRWKMALKAFSGEVLPTKEVCRRATCSLQRLSWGFCKGDVCSVSPSGNSSEVYHSVFVTPPFNAKAT